MRAFWLYFPFALALLGAYLGWADLYPNDPIWVRLLKPLTGFIMLGLVGQIARKLFSRDDFGD